MPLGPISGKSHQTFFGFYLAARKNRRRALLRSQRSFEPARPRARRILDDLRGTGARSSALPHTPTCRELYCRRIVGPVMVRIGFERNEPWLKKVLAIAFLSLMDRLSPSIHDVNAERAELIAIVIQNRSFSTRRHSSRKWKTFSGTHFARMEAQVHQLTVTTDAARLHSTQECASEALMPGRRPWLCGPGPSHSTLAPSRSRCRANTSLAWRRQSSRRPCTFVCVLYMKTNFTLFHCPLSVGRRPTL